jgi:hypothetical protein
MQEGVQSYRLPVLRPLGMPGRAAIDSLSLFPLSLRSHHYPSPPALIHFCLSSITIDLSLEATSCLSLPPSTIPVPPAAIPLLRRAFIRYCLSYGPPLQVLTHVCILSTPPPDSLTRAVSEDLHARQPELAF